jgi:hypothetical protein
MREYERKAWGHSDFCLDETGVTDEEWKTCHSLKDHHYPGHWTENNVWACDGWARRSEQTVQDYEGVWVEKDHSHTDNRLILDKPNVSLVLDDAHEGEELRGCVV